MSLRITLAAAAVVALIACKGASGGPAASSGSDYTIEAAPVKASVNGKVDAVVRFKPAAGLHWNEEFPAKLKVTDPGSVKADKDLFPTGDFKVDAGAGSLAIGLTAGAAGRTTVKAAADFSMCTEKECRIFKGIPIEVSVDVQ